MATPTNNSDLPPGFTLDKPSHEAVSDLPPGFKLDAPGKSGQMSTAERFGTGLADPVHGLAQLAAHATPAPVEQKVNQFNNWLADKGVPLARIPEGGIDALERTREANIKATSPSGFDAARLAGNVLSPVNLAAPTGASVGAGVLGRAALGGATGAMAQPVLGGDSFLKEKAKQAGEGALLGGALGGVTSAAGKIAKPEFDKAVNTLLGEGVKLTPGQLGVGSGKIGDAVKGTESKASSFFATGDVVKSAYRSTLESFNRAVLDKALAPIGEKLPKDIGAGREAYAYISKRLGEKYNELLPKLTFKADGEFAQKYAELKQLAAELPEPYAGQFSKFTERNIDKKLGETAQMDGRSFKELESDLGAEIRSYAKGSPSDKKYATALQEAQSLMRANLSRVNPDYAEDLSSLNKGYASYVLARDASVRRAGSGGVFTANDLLNAIRQGSSKNQFAAGAAHLQELADAGAKVLPSSVPDSGTAGRAALIETLAALSSGGGSVLMGNPAAALGVMGAMAPYTNAGLSGLQKWATGAPASRAAVRKMVEDLGGAATPGLAGGASRGNLTGGQK